MCYLPASKKKVVLIILTPNWNRLRKNCTVNTYLPTSLITKLKITLFTLNIKNECAISGTPKVIYYWFNFSLFAGRFSWQHRDWLTICCRNNLCILCLGLQCMIHRLKWIFFYHVFLCYLYRPWNHPASERRTSGNRAQIWYFFKLQDPLSSISPRVSFVRP